MYKKMLTGILVAGLGLHGVAGTAVEGLRAATRPTYSTRKTKLIKAIAALLAADTAVRGKSSLLGHGAHNMRKLGSWLYHGSETGRFVDAQAHLKRNWGKYLMLLTALLSTRKIAKCKKQYAHTIRTGVHDWLDSRQSWGNAMAHPLRTERAPHNPALDDAASASPVGEHRHAFVGEDGPPRGPYRSFNDRAHAMAADQLFAPVIAPSVSAAVGPATTDAVISEPVAPGGDGYDVPHIVASDSAPLTVAAPQVSAALTQLRAMRAAKFPGHLAQPAATATAPAVPQAIAAPLIVPPAVVDTDATIATADSSPFTPLSLATARTTTAAQQAPPASISARREVIAAPLPFRTILATTETGIPLVKDFADFTQWKKEREHGGTQHFAFVKIPHFLLETHNSQAGCYSFVDDAAYSAIGFANPTAQTYIQIKSDGRVIIMQPAATAASRPRVVGITEKVW